mgnify:CR=1 FL=1
MNYSTTAAADTTSGQKSGNFGNFASRPHFDYTLLNLGLSLEAIAIASYLAMRSREVDPEGAPGVFQAWPSQADIAETCLRGSYPVMSAGAIRRKVFQAIAELEACQVITVERFGNRENNRYTFNHREFWVKRSEADATFDSTNIHRKRVMIPPRSSGKKASDDPPMRIARSPHDHSDDPPTITNIDLVINNQDQDLDPPIVPPEGGVSPQVEQGSKKALTKTQLERMSIPDIEALMLNPEMWAGVPEDPETGQEEQLGIYGWYLKYITEPNGASIGKRKAAAISFYQLERRKDFDPARFRKGCSLYWQHKDQERRESHDGKAIGIPHLRTFLVGKKCHNWEAELEQAEQSRADRTFLGEAAPALASDDSMSWTSYLNSEDREFADPEDDEDMLTLEASFEEAA